MKLIENLDKKVEFLYIRSGLRNELFKKEKEEKVLLIALCGESASGKTTLLKQLKKDHSDLTVVNADNYYRDFSKEMTEFGSFSKLVESGYDTESSRSFQMDLLYQDLIKLKSGENIKTPHYNMITGQSTPHCINISPNKYVIVESICTLYEEVRDLFDFKIYLTVDKDIQWERYQKRITERNIDPTVIQKQYEIVSQSAERYIRPNQKYADLIIKSRIIKEHF